MNVFQSRDRVTRDRHDDIADDQPGFVGWSLRLDFEHDCGGFFFALQRLTKRVGQSHKLEAYAEITARHTALLQQRVRDRAHRGGGNRDHTEAGESGSRGPDDLPACIHDRAANAFRQGLELPYFARNVLFKLLILAKLGKVTKLLGGTGEWPY